MLRVMYCATLIHISNQHNIPKKCLKELITLGKRHVVQTHINSMQNRVNSINIP